MKHILITLFIIINFAQAYSQLNIDANIEKARKDIVRNKYHLAIKRLNRVIKFKSDSYQAYFFRAIAKFELSDYTGAVNDFSTVIQYNPFLPDAYHYRGVAKNALNDYNSALNDYDKAANMDVNNTGIFINRGLTKIQIKNYSAAIEDFNKALRINPEFVEVYLYRAAAKTGLKLYESAINDCNYAIRIKEFNGKAFVRRALIKYEQKKFKEAIKDLDFAIKLNAKDPYTYYIRALAKYQINDLKGSLKDYGNLIKLSPYNALAYYNRAMINIKINKYQNAISDLSKVIKLKPIHVLSYYNRAFLNNNLKNYDAAINDLSKSIELYPDFGEAYYMRSMIKRNLGLRQSAKKDYDIAINKMEAQNNDTSIVSLNTKKYQKVIELEANFDKQLVAGDKLYSVYSGIDPLPDYLLDLYTNYHTIQTIENNNSKYIRITDSLYLFADNQNDTTIDENKIQLVIDSLKLTKTNKYIINYTQAILNSRLHDYNSSLIAFDKTINLKPDFVYAYLYRAKVRLEMWDFVNNFDKNLNLSINGKIGNSNENKKINYNYSNILKDYDKAIELKPDLAISYFNRANFKVRIGNYNGALSDYKQAIKLDADFADAYYNLALLCIYQQNMSQACAYLSKSGELGQEMAYLVIKRYCKK